VTSPIPSHTRIILRGYEPCALILRTHIRNQHERRRRRELYYAVTSLRMERYIPQPLAEYSQKLRKPPQKFETTYQRFRGRIPSPSVKVLKHYRTCIDSIQLLKTSHIDADNNPSSRKYIHSVLYMLMIAGKRMYSISGTSYPCIYEL